MCIGIALLSLKHTFCLCGYSHTVTVCVVHSTNLIDRTSDTRDTYTLDDRRRETFCRCSCVGSAIVFFFVPFVVHCTNRSRRMHVNECVVILLSTVYAFVMFVTHSIRIHIASGPNVHVFI